MVKEAEDKSKRKLAEYRVEDHPEYNHSIAKLK